MRNRLIPQRNFNEIFLGIFDAFANCFRNVARFAKSSANLAIAVADEEWLEQMLDRHQVLLAELGIEDEWFEERVNVHGGAIALGHPLGATGGKLTATLLHGMKRDKQKYGLVSMCIGTGMGAAGIFESLA